MLTIGASQASVDGAARPIDSANPGVVPVIRESRTYVPLRFVAEALGADVGFDNGTITLTLSQ